MLLLLFQGTAPPPPIAGPGTRLGLNAVPARRWPAFPPRAPQTILALDPGNLSWLGRTPNVPVRLNLDPAQLRWIGRTIPGAHFTDLSLGAVPGHRRGPFPIRAPKTLLVLDPATLTWTGQIVNINQNQLGPGALSWIGRDVVVRVRGALRPFTRLGLNAVPGRRGLAFPARDALTPTPAGLTWQGQDVVVRVMQVLVLDPAVLTWIGRDVTTPQAAALDERALEPLEGVS